MENRLSLTIACSSIMASLAALLALLPLSFSYPIIPYLKFDVAEIPVVLAFFLLGPEAGLISSIVYWVILLLVGSYTPLGPTMKFIAVISMVAGLWLGFRLLKNPRWGLLLGSCIGCLLRVLTMGILNYLILVFLFPEFLEIAAASISMVLGLRLSGEGMALILVIIFTALFNVLHTVLSIIPAYLLVRSVAGIGAKNLRISGIWYARMVRAASRQAPQRS
ncbi:MAG: hypothetical protein DRN59_04100 [Thaumarchaeota archaeon]|nr:MAG: hypothetical protein DRN59_04100 [Nitrososphaerota archaeon]